jgi:hypothetical protein
VEQYRDDLRQKYGHIPSMAELAKMERRKMDPQFRSEEASKVTEVQKRYAETASRVRAGKTRAATELILRHLTKPMRAQDLEPFVCMTRQKIGSLLRGAYERGEVIKSAYNREAGTVWERVK